MDEAKGKAKRGIAAAEGARENPPHAPVWRRTCRRTGASSENRRHGLPREAEEPDPTRNGPDGRGTRDRVRRDTPACRDTGESAV